MASQVFTYGGSRIVDTRIDFSLISLDPKQNVLKLAVIAHLQHGIAFIGLVKVYMKTGEELDFQRLKMEIRESIQSMLDKYLKNSVKGEGETIVIW